LPEEDSQKWFAQVSERPNAGRGVDDWGSRGTGCTSNHKLRRATLLAPKLRVRKSCIAHQRARFQAGSPVLRRSSSSLLRNWRRSMLSERLLGYFHPPPLSIRASLRSELLDRAVQVPKRCRIVLAMESQRRAW